jgi:Zn-dependent peptidase ImmA (M78 family)
VSADDGGDTGAGTSGVGGDDTDGASPLTVRSASLLLQRLGIDGPEELDVEAIAQACGATVVYEPLSGCEARIVGVRDRAIITVDSGASRPRQRFSAAHELGHWLHDRGRVAFACAAGALVTEWGRENPERRANRFAAELLLPRTMFKRRARNRPITVRTVRELAAEFQTSLTATAIRLVELGSFPALVVCHDDGRRRWSAASPLLPPELVVLPERRGGAAAASPQPAPASRWVALDGVALDAAGSRTVIEDTLPLGQGLALTLLWWRDEAPAPIALAAAVRNRPRPGMSGRATSE